MKTTAILSVGAIIAACSSANAAIFAWDWNRGEPVSAGINDTGGAIGGISTTFDTLTNRFTWEVTFTNQVTDGFTLVLSPGANPKGHAGELAIIYFDNKDMNAPRISAYNYNGLNTLTSYKDGAPIDGNQTPDRITNSLLEGPAFESITAQDVGTTRVLSFAMDATSLNVHNPLYPSGQNDWTGVAYGEALGIWFHPIKNLNRSYNDSGYLTNWSGNHGWMDGFGIATREVPTPGSVALLGLGGVVALRRKRSA
ncbi:MAG: hypothetical protein ACKVZJ_00500 [Phycisphaerales bacterium]